MLRLFLCFLFVIGLVLPAWGQPDNHKIVTIDVLPDKVDLKPGQSYKFIARGFNRYYQEVTPFVPEWSCTGGTITQDGTYIAGNYDGVHSVTALFGRTGAQGSAVVVIKRSPDVSTTVPNFVQVSRLTINPSQISMNPGESVRFNITVYNVYGQSFAPSFTPIWKVTGGSITSDGTYIAGGVPGNYMVRAQDPSTGIAVDASVTIMGTVGRLSYIQIFPRDVKIGAYKEQRFFATGYDGGGNIVNVTPIWEASGGRIDLNGIYIAGGEPGTYYIKATAPGIGVSSTAKIIIEDLEIIRVEVSPKQATLVPGQILKFHLQAFDRNNNLTSIMPLWGATGGIIQVNGTYQAGRIPGNYSVTVTVGRKNLLTIPIEILENANTPFTLEIIPKDVILTPKQQLKFMAKAYNKMGKEVKANIHWTARGGIMDADGVYQAGANLGKYLLEASTGDDIIAKAWITISPGPVANLSITPETITLQPGQTNQYFVTATDSNGYKTDAPLIWSVESGDISKDGIYVAGSQPGTFTIQVMTENGVKATAKVTVLPNQLSPVQPPVIRPDDTLDTRFFQLMLWQIITKDDIQDSYKIQVRLMSSEGNKIQLILDRWDGIEQVLSTLQVRRGQAFELTGNYNRSDVQAIKIVLINSMEQRIYEFRRTTQR